MAIKAIAKLDSPIFDRTARSSKVSSFVSRSAKKFKSGTKQKMIKGPHTGSLYEKKRGAGFRRAHRASQRGQRPSPDTMTLVNAISDRMLSGTSAEVYIAERVNPENGTLASNYGEILQTKLDRPIMTADDALEAEKEMAREGEQLVRDLI